MINRKDFIEEVKDLFDETDPLEITLDVEFRDLEEWSSLIGMGLMAMAQSAYNVKVSTAELQKIKTFEDLAQLIDQKSS